jgi:hypothetical protein
MATTVVSPKSSAIETILVHSPSQSGPGYVQIEFKSSGKVYNYAYSASFHNELKSSDENTSFGRMVSINLRNGNLVPA